MKTAGKCAEPSVEEISLRNSTTEEGFAWPPIDLIFDGGVSLPPPSYRRARQHAGVTYIRDYFL